MPAYPAFLPTQDPDVALVRRQIVRRLATIDGAGFHHGAMYYSTTGTLELARMHTAERLAKLAPVARERYYEAATLYRNGETECSWCSRTITDLFAVVAIGDRLVHAGACRSEFHSFTSDHAELAL